VTELVAPARARAKSRAVGNRSAGLRASAVWIAKEPLAEDRSQLRVEHLERDRPVMADIVGTVDHSHAARTQLALDAVAVGEGGLKRG
jgi:hypothetical protein